jgi:hypothetical protein
MFVPQTIVAINPLFLLDILDEGQPMNVYEKDLAQEHVQSIDK